MHPNPCLVDGSLSDAVEALAQRAVALRSGAPRMSKEAMDKTAILGAVGNWWQGLDPTAKGALVGGGVGAGLGLGSSYLNSDEENRRPMSSALTGGLAGAAMGAGLGLAGKTAPIPPSAPPKQLTDRDGNPIRVKPGVKPEQVKQLDELASAGKPSWLSEFLGKRVYEGATAPFRHFPITSSLFTAKGLHGLREGRYNVEAGQSGNAHHADLGLADTLKDMKVTPGKPGTTTTNMRPRIDPASGNQVYDASGELLRDTTTTSTPATPDTLANSSRLKGVNSIPEMESLRHLSNWINRDPVAARRFLQHRDVTQLDPALQSQLQHLRPETLTDLQRHGSRLDLAKKTVDEAITPRLRRSRLYDSAQEGGLLNRLTGGRSSRWNVEPHVNMSRWGGKARTFGKYAPLYGLSALGENYAHDMLSQWLAKRRYQSALSDLTEPAK